MRTKLDAQWIGLLRGDIQSCLKRSGDRVQAAPWCLLLLVLLLTSQVNAQDIFISNGGGNPSPYEDEFSTNCNQGNTGNPYASMDPLSCHGVMAPTDSRNDCSLRGMTLLQKWGNTCYYCQPLNPPIDGILIPLDQVANADRQGYRCGVDQANPKCMAICTGGGQYTPPGGDQLFGAPPQRSCVQAPYDVRADVPGATPQNRYILGFERGNAACLESQVTVQNLALAALASRFKAIAAVLVVAAAPGVIDAVLHPPGSSDNPNPYQRGVDEGSRLCTWALKISPVAVARCPVAAETGAVCSANALASGLREAYGNAAAEEAKRFDCFTCTLAWLRGDAYTPPANGGLPLRLVQIEQFLQRQYGNQVPQGPQLPCWRQAAQAKGIPGSMSPVGIVNEMTQAGDGAQGFVFIRDLMSNEIGHVFGVKTENGQVNFWDEQQQMEGQLWFLPGQWTTFYRTK